MKYPDFTQPFILQTDASDEGLGFVLSQKIGGVERPVSFVGKVLPPASKNYSTFEKEALGLVEGSIV